MFQYEKKLGNFILDNQICEIKDKILVETAISRNKFYLQAVILSYGVDFQLILAEGLNGAYEFELYIY